MPYFSKKYAMLKLTGKNFKASSYGQSNRPNHCGAGGYRQLRCRLSHRGLCINNAGNGAGINHMVKFAIPPQTQSKITSVTHRYFLFSGLSRMVRCLSNYVPS